MSKVHYAMTATIVWFNIVYILEQTSSCNQNLSEHDLVGEEYLIGKV